MNKLYETNSYMTECTATVRSIHSQEGKILITLSDSILFPEEGGQYADTGYIKYGNKEIAVLDGQIIKGEIYYSVSEEIAPGTEVKVCLDFKKRFSRMQQHTAEHILCGLIHSKYGYDNVGFHLSDDAPVTMDVDGPLSPSQVYEIEKLANQVVSMNLPVKDTYPTKEELEEISYRSKKEIDGQVRLITIGDDKNLIDVCACCAPHVALTGEIGMITIASVQSYKGGSRISLLAGDRAFTYVRENLNLLSDIARKLTTSPGNVCDVLDKQTEEMSRLKAGLSKLSEEKLITLINSAEGDNRCIFMSEEISSGVIRKALEQSMNNVPGYIIVLIGDEEKGFSYTCCSTNKSAVAMQKLMAEKLGAKGGGKEPMVSGRIKATKMEIESLFN